MKFSPQSHLHPHHHPCWEHTFGSSAPGWPGRSWRGWQQWTQPLQRRWWWKGLSMTNWICIHWSWPQITHSGRSFCSPRAGSTGFHGDLQGGGKGHKSAEYWLILLFWVRDWMAEERFSGNSRFTKLYNIQGEMEQKLSLSKSHYAAPGN